MLGNGIIAFIVGGAFVRAGYEYGKNGLAWGVIGLAAFFVPSLAIPILVTLLLTLSGASPNTASGAFGLAGLLGLAAGVGADGALHQLVIGPNCKGLSGARCGNAKA